MILVDNFVGCVSAKSVCSNKQQILPKKKKPTSVWDYPHFTLGLYILIGGTIACSYNITVKKKKTPFSCIFGIGMEIGNHVSEELFLQHSVDSQYSQSFVVENTEE